MVALKSRRVTVGKLGATRIHWQLDKFGEYKDLKVDQMKVILDPNVCNIRPKISNEMEYQPMKEKKYIRTNCTSDTVS